MKLIGLTGGIASGKSLVESMLRKAQIPVIDADALAREVTAPNTEGLRQVLERFGDRFALPDGSLDRKALAQLVFSNDEARLALESITHPLISEAMQSRLTQYALAGHPYCVYSAALIFEKNRQDAFDAVILIFCNEPTQIERLMRRDDMTKDEAISRLSVQMPLSEKMKKTTYIIDNSSTPSQTARQLIEVWGKITGQSLLLAD